MTKPILIIGAIIALLTLGGFGMLISGAIELSRTPNMGSDPVIAMVFVGMITIMATDFFLVRLLSKLINAALSAPGAQPQFNRAVGVAHAPAQLPQANTSPFQQAPSVTENTTRFFEPVYRAPADAVPPLKNSKE